MAKRKRKVRLGIIGCGGFVHSHVHGINAHVPEFEFVGLADIDRSHAERLTRALPEGAEPPIYTDYAKMLTDVKPDAVIVSSPHTLHFRHCYDALGAGTHVMVEKPMVTRAADARKLVARAKAKRRALNIAIQGTHTSTFAYARKILHDSTMGELQLVTGWLAQGWMAATRGTWRQNPRLSGGGQLYDSCAHVLSAMVFLVDSPVREVFCWTDNKGTKVDINAVAAIRFANGAMGTVTSGGNSQAGCMTQLQFQSANGVVDMSVHQDAFCAYGAAFKKPVTAVPRGWKVPTVSPARNFADVILRKAQPRCTGRLGILLADLMDALYQSARTGKPAKVTRRAP